MTRTLWRYMYIFSWIRQGTGNTNLIPHKFRVSGLTLIRGAECRSVGRTSGHTWTWSRTSLIIIWVPHFSHPNGNRIWVCTLKPPDHRDEMMDATSAALIPWSIPGRAADPALVNGFSIEISVHSWTDNARGNGLYSAPIQLGGTMN